MRTLGARRPIALATGIAALGLISWAPAAHSAAKGFEYGVAAGDVSARSAILWAKAEGKGDVLVQVQSRGRFGKCDVDGAKRKFLVDAKAANDFTVQKKVRGLAPGKRYRYRFCTEDGDRSATGKFETAPAPKAKQTVRFALSGDQDLRPLPGETEPYWNRMEVWDAIRAQRNDFNVLLGDTIYSDTEVPGYTLDDVALTVEQKWEAYKINLGKQLGPDARPDPSASPWAKARGSASYYGGWDDHEFVNDFSRFENTFPLGVGDVNIDGETLYKRGVNAFRDYNPISYKRKTGSYRHFRWGKNLEIFILDERSFRSASADYQGNCDNPPGSGNPDLAPTAPQANRDIFAVLDPELGNPPPPACVAAINDPDRTMLGAKQLARFKRDIERSKATFKVVLNEVPIQQYYALPYDRWEGYEAERREILTHIRDNVKNAVFLTTDVHGNLVNDARFQTLEAGGPQDSGILDIVTGPVATATYSLEISDTLGTEAGGTLLHDVFFKPPPPNGVGMQCAAIDQFSYAQVQVSKQELRVELLDQDDQPVLDTGDREAGGPPCAPIVIPKQ